MTKLADILPRKNISARLGLLLLYLLFLFVQVGFNYDTGSRSFQRVPAGISNAGQHQLSAHTAAHTSFKSKLRLNKRYFPSGIPAIPACLAPVATVYVVPQLPAAYDDAVYFSFHLSAHALRGPPAA